MKHARVLTAEFLGTFALTFFGAGSICADAFVRGPIPFGPGDLLLVATAHAMVLGVMITALGHISGAHFNPAVTVAAAVARKIAPALAGMYVVTQLVAGVAAAGLLRYIFPDAVTAAVKLGAPVPAGGLGNIHGMVIEVILTFFLVTVVFATAVDPRGAFGKIAGFGIGFVLFFDILMGGPLTGAAMNPARAFGPALLGGALDGRHFLLYWAAPVLGAVAAGMLYERVLIHGSEDVETDVPPPSTERA
ncbi:MAG: MIP/aquaporin family protein [Candidatus Dormibacteria bacterium]